MARAKKSTATKAAKRTKTGTRIDVKALRARLGASQSAFAKLVGASGGSVQNWEKGKPVSAKYVQKLRALEQQAATGKVDVPAPRRGRRPKKPGAPTKAADVRLRGATTLTGDATVAYANTISTARNGTDVRLRFGFAVPGEKSARLVADLVVPTGMLEQLRG
jgi:DNA-binding transcriptional regulator YiaG